MTLHYTADIFFPCYWMSHIVVEPLKESHWLFSSTLYLLLFPFLKNDFVNHFLNIYSKNGDGISIHCNNTHCMHVCMQKLYVKFSAIIIAVTCRERIYAKKRANNNWAKRSTSFCCVFPSLFLRDSSEPQVQNIFY